ncbi:MAG: hypothetical protein K2X27_02945 [Candidatus Obscuribacterales bacterium]|nr:hypothetical protein [Candidatus Obscuribacterales bacterium]
MLTCKELKNRLSVLTKRRALLLSRMELQSSCENEQKSFWFVAYSLQTQIDSLAAQVDSTLAMCSDGPEGIELDPEMGSGICQVYQISPKVLSSALPIIMRELLSTIQNLLEKSEGFFQDCIS